MEGSRSLLLLSVVSGITEVCSLNRDRGDKFCTEARRERCWWSAELEEASGVSSAVTLLATEL